MTTPNLPPPTPNTWAPPVAPGTVVAAPVATNVFNAPPVGAPATASNANWAPPVAPGNAAPAAHNQAPEPDDDAEIITMFEEVLHPELMLKFQKEINAIGDAFVDFEELNSKPLTLPEAVTAAVNTRKQELSTQFGRQAEDRRGYLHQKTEPKAREIEDQKFDDLDPKNTNERIAVIQTRLDSRLDETFNAMLPDARQKADEAVESRVIKIEDDPELTVKADELKDEIKLRLLEGDPVANQDPDAEPDVDLKYLFEELKQLTKVDKKRLIGKTATSRDWLNEDQTKDVQEVLNEIMNHIVVSIKEMPRLKGKKIAEWAEQKYGKGINESGLSAEFDAIARGHEAEVAKAFFDDKNMALLVAREIVPELSQAQFSAIMQPEKGAPAPNTPTTTAPNTTTSPNTNPNQNAHDFVPKLVTLVAGNEMAGLSAHIGEYLSAGGDPQRLEAAFNTASAAPKNKATRLAIITGILTIPKV